MSTLVVFHAHPDDEAIATGGTMAKAAAAGHRVGVRAAELAGTSKVALHTIDKDFVRKPMADAVEAGAFEADAFDPDAVDIGMASERITTTVDVLDLVDLERKAKRSHASQISDASFLLAMAPEMFRVAFGQEWCILVGSAPGRTHEADLFAGL